jgi:hypothetical protein
MVVEMSSDRFLDADDRWFRLAGVSVDLWSRAMESFSTNSLHNAK